MDILDNNANKKWYISQSDIHGRGVFSARRLRKNTKIGTGIKYVLGIIPRITKDLGSLINHSHSPNAELRYDSLERTYNIYTLKIIPKDTEITINYDNTPWFIEGAKEWYT